MGKWNNDYNYHNDSWSVNKNHNQWKKSSNYHRQSSWHKSDRGDRNRSYWRGDNDNDSVSKWLTYVLRHGASEEDVYMDKHGYVSVDQLIALREKEFGKTTNLYQIRLVVETCPKQRFEIWEDEQNEGKTWVRATQGHSISKVQDTVHRPLRSADDLGNEEPVHGTFLHAWLRIRHEGLKTMGRNHIHMCMGLPGTGVISGMREDADVAIYINVALAMQSGICFVQSSNGVILTVGEGDTKTLSTNFFSKVYWMGRGSDSEKMLIWDKQQGDLLEELRKTCEDLADAVDRAEWQEQSKSNKPAAKKMPKPKKMPESLRCSGAMRPPEPERPPSSILAPTLCKASAPPPLPPPPPMDNDLDSVAGVPSEQFNDMVASNSVPSHPAWQAEMQHAVGHVPSPATQQQMSLEAAHHPSAHRVPSAQTDHQEQSVTDGQWAAYYQQQQASHAYYQQQQQQQAMHHAPSAPSVPSAQTDHQAQRALDEQRALAETARLQQHQQHQAWAAASSPSWHGHSAAQTPHSMQGAPWQWVHVQASQATTLCHNMGQALAPQAMSPQMNAQMSAQMQVQMNAHMNAQMNTQMNAQAPPPPPTGNNPGNPPWRREPPKNQEEHNTMALPGMAQSDTGEVRAMSTAEQMNRLNTMNPVPELPAQQAKTQPDAGQRAASRTKEAKDDPTGRIKHQEVSTSKPSQPKTQKSTPLVSYEVSSDGSYSDTEDSDSRARKDSDSDSDSDAEVVEKPKQAEAKVERKKDIDLFLSLQQVILCSQRSSSLHKEHQNWYLHKGRIIDEALIGFSSIVGSVTNSVAQLQALHGNSRRQFWLLRKYLNEKGIYEPTRTRLFSFLEHEVERRRKDIKEEDVRLLSLLSSPLQNLLAYELHRGPMTGHPFFSLLDQHMQPVMYSLCHTAMKFKHFAMEDMCFVEAEGGKFMWVLIEGSFSYIRAANLYKLSTPGTWLSEPVLWTSWWHRGNLEAASTSGQLAFVSPSAMVNCFKSHPRPWFYARTYAMKYVRVLNRMSVARLSDIHTVEEEEVKVMAAESAELQKMS